MALKGWDILSNSWCALKNEIRRGASVKMGCSSKEGEMGLPSNAGKVNTRRHRRSVGGNHMAQEVQVWCGRIKELHVVVGPINRKKKKDWEMWTVAGRRNRRAIVLRKTVQRQLWFIKISFPRREKDIEEKRVEDAGWTSQRHLGKLGTLRHVSWKELESNNSEDDYVIAVVGLARMVTGNSRWECCFLLIGCCLFLFFIWPYCCFYAFLAFTQSKKKGDSCTDFLLIFFKCLSCFDLGKWTTFRLANQLKRASEHWSLDGLVLLLAVLEYFRDYILWTSAVEVVNLKEKFSFMVWTSYYS